MAQTRKEGFRREIDLLRGARREFLLKDQKDPGAAGRQLEGKARGALAGSREAPRESWGLSGLGLHVVHSEAASRKSLPFKVKRTANTADLGKFLP